MKIKFIGKSDINFTNGNIYQLIKLDLKQIYRPIDLAYEYLYSYDAYISNNDNKIVIIPYAGINNFNDNWEVVNEIK